GETEKNLAALFAKAEHKDWILFFDEADALFGKRTNVRDAHDKYANQEVSYLLQRIEAYPGLVILASNFKSNIDDAFIRRFQSSIFFPVPKAHDRLRIWEKAFPQSVELGDDLELQMIARKYEMTGSNIMNVVQVACLKALSEARQIIQLDDVLQGIEKEFAKEGKLH
ncbi:MAG: ATP-binding protein, partial [Bacteroidota bacterium]